MFGYIRRKYNFFIINNILDNQFAPKAFAKKRQCFRRIGNNIADDVRIVGPIHSLCKTTIGKGTFVGRCFTCEGNGPIEIGENCDIAPQVTILTGTHEIGDKARRAGKGITEGVTIGNGTWIGARTIILPGIKVGNGCVIAAGAIVTKDVPDNSMAIGVPARIREINDDTKQKMVRNERKTV